MRQCSHFVDAITATTWTRTAMSAHAQKLVSLDYIWTLTNYTLMNSCSECILLVKDPRYDQRSGVTTGVRTSVH